MSALSYLAPEFIKEGRLCWLHAPLYLVDTKGKMSYYFTDEELEEDKRKGKIKGHISRNKGLGEMDAEEARVSMFTDEYQRMDVMEYDVEAIALLNELMGIDVLPRRNFIMENVDFSKVTE